QSSISTPNTLLNKSPINSNNNISLVIFIVSIISAVIGTTLVLFCLRACWNLYKAKGFEVIATPGSK
ncbi:3890_t:CDS:1, partial [Scutellospora calospora]